MRCPTCRTWTRVAIQTNLAGPLAGWPTADPAGWRSGPPTTRVRCSRTGSSASAPRLDRLGVRYSVGVVGLPEHLAEAAGAARRAARPRCTCGSTRPRATPTTRPTRPHWTAIDPLFGYSVRPHASAGHECRAGETVHLGAGRRDGAPVPLRPDAAGQPLRRLVPGRAGPRAVRRTPSATATSATCTSSGCRSTTSSPAGCWSGSRAGAARCGAYPWVRSARQSASSRPRSRPKVHATPARAVADVGRHPQEVGAPSAVRLGRRVDHLDHHQRLVAGEVDPPQHAGLVRVHLGRARCRAGSARSRSTPASPGGPRRSLRLDPLDGQVGSSAATSGGIGMPRQACRPQPSG